MSDNSIMSQEQIEEMLRNAGQVDAAPPSDNAVMSQEQIEEMLRSAEQGDAAASATSAEDFSLDSYFTRDEQDALGEMGNICMGTAATTMYTLLGKQVTITTPSLSIHTWETLAAEHPLPMVVVEVQYIEGISGNNMLLLKEYDVALITDLLMGGSGNIDPDNVVLDEISLSAIREVMNQMVGSSATSLASMLHKTINISTPASKRVLIAEEPLSESLDGNEKILKISFRMEIEGLLSSEIMQILPIDFAQQIAGELLNPQPMEDPGAGAAQSDASVNVHAQQRADHIPEAVQTPPPAPNPAPAQPQPQPPQPAPEMQQPAGQPAQGASQPYAPDPPYPDAPYPQDPPQYPPQYPQSPPQGAPQPQPQPYPAGGMLRDPASVDAKKVEYPVFGAGSGEGGAIDTQNLWRLLDVPMEVTVELGRCTKTIKQVLDLNVGSVVVLDKLAGELVEVMVNGIQVARGEVVVIDDSYGVRITELNAAELSEIARKD